MVRKIDLGKIAWTGKQKSYAVDLEIDLREDRFQRPVLSICGNVWNTKHTDIVCGGQCLDEIAKYIHQLDEPNLFIFIYKMWKKYHLNDMHAGTPEQEQELKTWRMTLDHSPSYDECCRHLESVGLYEVEYHGCEYNGVYKYGTAWLYQPIDADDLDRIFDTLGIERHD